MPSVEHLASFSVENSQCRERAQVSPFTGTEDLLTMPTPFRQVLVQSCAVTCSFLGTGVGVVLDILRLTIPPATTAASFPEANTLQSQNGTRGHTISLHLMSGHIQTQGPTYQPCQWWERSSALDFMRDLT